MGGPYVQIPVGSVAYYESRNRGRPLLNFYLEDDKEGLDEFESLQYSIKKAYITAKSSLMLENQELLECFSLVDQKQLQIYDFEVYLQSCKFIKFEICPNKLLEGNMLDTKHFPALNEKEIVNLLTGHINELKELESIHEIYAYMKSLANLEFIKCDSDFDEILHQLKYEENWADVSDNVLKIALRQHLSLLQKLKIDSKTTDGVIPNKPTELFTSDIQEAVDCEYCAELQKFVQMRLERRLKCYHQHMEFMRLFSQSVADFDAQGVNYVCTVDRLSTPKMHPVKSLVLDMLNSLPRKKDALNVPSKVESSWIGRRLPHLVNHARSISTGRPTKAWPVLMVSVGLVAGFGMSRKMV